MPESKDVDVEKVNVVEGQVDDEVQVADENEKGNESPAVESPAVESEGSGKGEGEAV